MSRPGRGIEHSADGRRAHHTARDGTPHSSDGSGQHRSRAPVAESSPMKATDQLDSPYLTTAVAIGDQLVHTAIPGSPGVTWEGDDVLGDDIRSMSIVRGDVGAH